jgi:radical SAM family uncharacterized protein/radical SAM-linked protein
VSEAPCDALRSVLRGVVRPSRYIGQEHHVVRKDHSKTRVRFALAFPDVYEIGMSHVGSRILYHLVNARPEFVAERAYAPWPDMEASLRRSRTPLYTLDTYTPLSEFDVVGFSVQHELCYTNILGMLELAGIPLRVTERTAGHPLVIAGGPCVANPEPIADFMDAIVLGDGEEAILEIGEALSGARAQRLPRQELLWNLSRLPGVYVPSLYRQRDGAVEPIDPSTPSTISRRVHPSLGLDDFPMRPLVPLTEVVHDRLSIEIMRGCPQACRFCQATQVYAPCRMRTAEAILKIAQTGIEHSGWDEISLVSLSTGEYPNLVGLVSRINLAFSGKNVALSLPSLRPATFNRELAEELTRVRRTGLTFAPEAGTDQLRSSIGKPMHEDAVLQALDTAFAAGHTSVKLYFMVGLPGERTEDLDGIVALGRAAERVARAHGRGARIHMSVAPFVPKPHTPFQWAAFEDTESLREKELLLRRRLRSQRIRLKWREPRLSFLEAVFSRGNRRLGPAIEAAFRRGARFDDWTDMFEPDLWFRAFQDCGVDPHGYAGARKEKESLAWDHLAVGRGKRWCLTEWTKAREESDGRRAAGPATQPNAATEPHAVRRQTAEYGRKPRPGAHISKRPTTVPRRVRVQYSRTGCARYLSHLDVVRAFVLGLRRLGIPLQYSEGYTPRPRLAFGHPLPLGVGSTAELVDVWLAAAPPRALDHALTQVLPEGMVVSATKEVFPKAPSLTEIVNAVSYEVRLGAVLTPDEATRRLETFMRRESWVIERETKGGRRRIDLRKQVVDACTDSGGSEPVLRIAVRAGQPGQGKPRDLVATILGLCTEDAETVTMDRTAQRVLRNGAYLSPMETWEDA